MKERKPRNTQFCLYSLVTSEKKIYKQSRTHTYTRALTHSQHEISTVDLKVDDHVVGRLHDAVALLLVQKYTL